MSYKSAIIQLSLWLAIVAITGCTQKPTALEDAKPGPAAKKGRARTQTELFAYSWKADEGKTALLINKEYFAHEGSTYLRKIKWISDTSFTTVNYYEISHEEPEIKKTDTMIFYGEDDWIKLKNISKKTYLTESIEVRPYYHRYKKR